MSAQALLFDVDWNRSPRPAPSPAASAPASEPTPIPGVVERLGLEDNLARKLLTGRELVRANERREAGTRLTAIRPLDALLNGLPRGAMTEIHGHRSSGRFSLVISAIASVTSCGENVALVDHGDALDPRNAEDAGVDLEHLLWVRPAKALDAVNAAELLITTGFPLVVLELGTRIRGRRPADAAWLRLSRAASATGAILLVSAPWPVCNLGKEASILLRRERTLWHRRGSGPSLLTGIGSKLHLAKQRSRTTTRSALTKLKTGEAI